MPYYRRSIAPGGTFFFTVITFNRRPIFNHHYARQCLRKAYLSTIQTFPFTNVAFCLLPDHIHCLWTLPDNDHDFSKRWNMIKGLFTRNWHQFENVDMLRNQSRIKKRESAVWQRRFWEHTIRDEIDFSNHFDYLHYNPVKHGYVENVCDWPWSTFHKYVKLQWYDHDWGQGVSEKLVLKRGGGE